MIGRQSVSNTISAEWMKFTTVRSTLWVLATTAVIVVGFSALAATAVTAAFDSGAGQFQQAFDATATSLAGISLAQIALGVLGVLVVTTEYSTGMIASTFAATPKRLRNFLAKVVVFAPLVLGFSVVISFAAFFLGQAIFSARDLDAGLGDPGVLRAVVGAALYLTLVGVMGITIGMLLRSTAASVTILAITFFVLPILGLVLPRWQEVLKFLPSNAGSAMASVEPTPGLLSPGAGAAVLGLWVVALFVVAGIRVVRSDA